MKSTKSNVTCTYLLVFLLICLIEQRKIKCEEKTNNACSFCYKNFLDGLDGLNGEQFALRKKQLNECNQRFFCVYDEFFLNNGCSKSVN